MNDLAIVHVAHGDALGSVYAAQVLHPMLAVQQRGYPVRLAAFASPAEYRRGPLRQRWIERRREAEELGLQLDRLFSPFRRLGWTKFDAWNLRRWLVERHSGVRRVMLHCRAEVAANVAIRAADGDPRFRVIFDCRGLSAEEYMYRMGYQTLHDAPHSVRRQVRARQDAQLRAARDAHAMICVSQRMKDMVAQRWEVPASKLWVVSCSTDASRGLTAFRSRDEYRRNLGVEERFVVAFCGSAPPWQMLEQTLTMFNFIREVRPEAHLLVVTTDVAAWSRAADDGAIPVSSRTIVSVRHAEVPRYLAAADVGLMLRNRNVVNLVASPVKFAEYLSCGVPVILTQDIGDCSSLVEREKIGLVAPDTSLSNDLKALVGGFLESYERNASAMRRRCLSVAEKDLSWQATGAVLVDVYKALDEARGGRDACDVPEQSDSGLAAGIRGPRS